MPDLLHCDRTAVILLGASDWTKCGLGRARSFARSASRYVGWMLDRHGLGIERDRLIDLFDSDAAAGAQLSLISDSLRQISQDMVADGSRLEDILIVYIGHGILSPSGQLSLLLKSSRKNMEEETGMRVSDLAGALKVSAAQQRFLGILDCCFAEAAVRSWVGMGPLGQAVTNSAARGLASAGAARGGLLLCACSSDEVAIGAPDDPATLFSGTLTEILRGGDSELPREFSFQHLRDAVDVRVLAKAGENAPRPVLHLVNQKAGDLRVVPAFRNAAAECVAPPALDEPRPEAEREGHRNAPTHQVKGSKRDPAADKEREPVAVQETSVSADEEEPDFQVLAIDLGTSNIRIVAPGRGIILEEPAIVAVDDRQVPPKISAVGSDAVSAFRTDSQLRGYRCLSGGVIADLPMATELLRVLVEKSLEQEGPPDLVIVASVPSGSTSVERAALSTALQGAGATGVWLIEEPMAAAIGADLPVTEPIGSMVVNIGAGATEVAVLSLRGLAYTTSVRVGGEAMDEAISAYIRRKHNLLIGDATAERIKKQVGIAKPPTDGDGLPVHIKGRNLVDGVPKELTINQKQIAEALSDPVGTIVESVRIALENTAPELAADIVDQGIMLTGGGALLQGLDEVLRDETGLPVTVADDPLTCVARGMGMVLEDSKLFGVLLAPPDP